MWWSKLWGVALFAAVFSLLALGSDNLTCQVQFIWELPGPGGLAISWCCSLSS